MTLISAPQNISKTSYTKTPTLVFSPLGAFLFATCTRTESFHFDVPSTFATGSIHLPMTCSVKAANTLGSIFLASLAMVLGDHRNPAHLAAISIWHQRNGENQFVHLDTFCSCFLFLPAGFFNFLVSSLYCQCGWESSATVGVLSFSSSSTARCFFPGTHVCNLLRSFTDTKLLLAFLILFLQPLLALIGFLSHFGCLKLALFPQALKVIMIMSILLLLCRLSPEHCDLLLLEDWGFGFRAEFLLRLLG